jgi:hypothetical protein
LLREAFLQSIPRWRFLQFYRILEQGYLDVILEKLKVEFKGAPKQALADASKSLESEYEQLRTLINTANLSGFFEEVVDLIASRKNDSMNPNRFAWNLEKGIEGRGSRKGDKGAALVYAIRCAIAHAGDRSVFYEQCEDADVLVLDILPVLESAVFSFIGISAN